MKKVKKINVEHIFHITYDDGSKVIMKDREISEKPLTLRQYTYLIYFPNTEVIKALDDSNRSK